MPKQFSVQPGDRVALSAAFLRSIGAQTGDLPQLRGTVQGVRQLTGDRQLVCVKWDSEPETQQILSCNLAHIGANSRFCAC